MTFVRYVWNKRNLVIDKLLAEYLVSIAYNCRNDWDFVILVSGNRGVRVGKSVCSFAIASYLAFLLDKMGINNDAFPCDLEDRPLNVYFDHQDMLTESMKKPHHSIIIYDEAREGLASQKASTKFQQDIIQFFNECGQLNHIYILNIADFFDMRESMAVGRSECLVNVYTTNEARSLKFSEEEEPIRVVKMLRGRFQFFNRPAKNLLFDFFRTTRKKSYTMVKPSFPVGLFTNQYPFSEEEYRKMKADALARFKTKETEKSDEEKELLRIRIEREKIKLENDKKKELEKDGKKIPIKEQRDQLIFALLERGFTDDKINELTLIQSSDLAKVKKRYAENLIKNKYGTQE